MEMIENPMIMPQPQYNTDWNKQEEIWAEQEDMRMEDNYAKN